MTTQEQQHEYLTQHQLTMNLQQKISQLFPLPIRQVIYLPDNIILVYRYGGEYVQVYVCDSGFREFQHMFQISGVKSLKDVQVKYNAEEKQIAFVYRTNKSINFYAGQIPNQNSSQKPPRSSLQNNPLRTAQFTIPQQTANISQIILNNIFGHHCILTTTSSKTYLIHSYKHTLNIHQTGPSSKLYSLFKTLTKPLTTTPTYNKYKCENFVYSSQNNGLYCVNLMDTVLQMKYFNIASSGSNWHELGNWEVDLSGVLGVGLEILERMFVYQEEVQGWHGVNLVLLCLVGDRVNMFIIGIDFNSKIKRIQVLQDILNIQQGHSTTQQQTQNETENQNNNDQQQSQMQQEQPQPQHPPILFNPQTDYFQLQYNNGKIFILYHKKLPNDYNIYTNMQRMFMMVKKIQDKLTVMTQAKIINVRGGVRLVKIQDVVNQRNMGSQGVRRKGKNYRVMLLGELHCYVFRFRTISNAYEMDEGIQDIFLPVPGRSSRLPPLPQFDENQIRIHRRNVQLSKVQAQKIKHGIIQQPYSFRNLEKYLYTRNYTQLFNSLDFQKQKLFNQMQETKIIQIMASNPSRVPQQLQNAILLRIFYIQDGINYRLDKQLVNEIFERNIFDNYCGKVNDKLFIILRNIFIKGYTEEKRNQQFKYLEQRSNSLHELNLIIKVLLDDKKYTPLYKICVETIPLFVKVILERFQKQLDSDMSELDTQGPRQMFQKLKAEFAISYLNLYQILLSRLQSNNYMPMQSVPPHRTKKQTSMSETSPYFVSETENQKNNYINFSQYHYKELLTKYLEMKYLTSTRRSLHEHRRQRNQKPHLYLENQSRIPMDDQNTSTLTSIVEMYLNISQRYINFFTTMATKYKNTTVFDYMLRRRLVNKSDMQKFLSQNWTQLEKNEVLRILYNLVQTEIKNISKTSHPENESLKILTWIPATCAEDVFGYLMRTFPKVGIMYGLTFKKRKELASYIANHIQIFDEFTEHKVSDVLELMEPFYTCNIQDKSVKLNIDLAKMFARAATPFKPAHKILKQTTIIKDPRIDIRSFSQKISKYLSPQDQKEILAKFSN